MALNCMRTITFILIGTVLITSHGNKGFAEAPSRGKSGKKVVQAEDSKQSESENPPAPELKIFIDYLTPAAEAYLNGDYKQALKILKRDREQSELRYSDRYHLLMGLCFLKMQDYQKAREELQISAQLRRSNSDTLHFLALSELNRKNPEAAVALLQEALWFDNYKLVMREETPILLVKIFTDGNQKERADQYLEFVRQSNPTGSQANRVVAQSYLNIGQKPQAIQFARRAYAHDKEDPENLLMLSQVLLHAPDRVLGSRDIMESKELSSGLLMRDDLEPDYRMRAQAIFVRSLIENQELESAEKTLASARKEFPHYDELVLLEQQLKIEKQAALNKPKKAKSEPGTRKIETQEAIFQTGSASE